MRRIVAVLAVALVLATAVPPAAAVHATGETFVVRLAENGDATVVLENRYNLTNESERRTFEALESNETRRQQRADRFDVRLQEGAAMARNATDRDVQAGEVTVNVTRANDTGVFRLEGSWTALAAVNTRHNILELRQPFRSGFQVNRTLRVVGPEGYTRAGTAPNPNIARKRGAYWGVQRNTSKLFIRFEGPSPGPSPTPTDQQTATVAPVTGEGLSALSGAVILALVPAVLVALALSRVR